ncbi:hypothetical protein LINPERPRIM_LOCUS26504 [Linum perenne]
MTHTFWTELRRKAMTCLTLAGLVLAPHVQAKL